jgi:hypothetical protein
MATATAPTPAAEITPATPPAAIAAAAPDPYRQTLLVSGDLPPQLLAFLHEQAATGARLTIVTIHRTSGEPADTRPASDDRPPLTAAEAAAHYRVEPATIRAWCREGRFPGAERLGKSWQIPAAAVRDHRPPTPPTSTDVGAPAAAHTPAADTAPTPDAPPDGPTADTARPRSAGRERTTGRTARMKDDGFDRATLADWRNL